MDQPLEEAILHSYSIGTSLSSLIFSLPRYRNKAHIYDSQLIQS